MSHLCFAFLGRRGLYTARGWGGGIMMALLWVVIVLGIVYIVKSAVNDKNFPQRKNIERDNSDIKENNSSAIEIARRRYAHGEIDKEEFNQIIRDLKNKSE
ncbi:MAG: SHOCT domain-containing protein [Halanaerobiales bacterium]